MDGLSSEAEEGMELGKGQDQAQPQPHADDPLPMPPPLLVPTGRTVRPTPASHTHPEKKKWPALCPAARARRRVVLQAPEVSSGTKPEGGGSLLLLLPPPPPAGPSPGGHFPTRQSPQGSYSAASTKANSTEQQPSSSAWVQHNGQHQGGGRQLLPERVSQPELKLELERVLDKARRVEEESPSRLKLQSKLERRETTELKKCGQRER
ncbi:poly [ADP-ribose] polymerase tankyrase-1-like [Hemicordylus capensis]|uniref:poly [ADP-ribose] polymerase tankyrase-1-like n=1 Tax=Hemicordylus capensis TaxID=884348 RepID=UPI002302F2E2|nr:poly [ADP-ribose] polymerase tankyrase-1-like [Hemicordylus capensis]